MILNKGRNCSVMNFLGKKCIKLGNLACKHKSNNFLMNRNVTGNDIVPRGHDEAKKTATKVGISRILGLVFGIVLVGFMFRNFVGLLRDMLVIGG